jgi:RNA polymerase sigma factor (sigma-70 family)
MIVAVRQTTPDTMPPPADDALPPQATPVGHADALLSDEPTIELLARAQGGDREAVEALLQRCLPDLKRWAHGRLPAAARGSLDTGDLVQETVMHVLRRLDHFEPRHVGAMQAYLRQSVINRIRDEVRRVTRRPPASELPEDLASDLTSPLEVAVKTEAYERYRAALTDMSSKDRELIVARIEAQWSVAEIAERFRMKSADAARMAVGRAVRKLTDRLHGVAG